MSSRAISIFQHSPKQFEGHIFLFDVNKKDFLIKDTKKDWYIEVAVFLFKHVYYDYVSSCNDITKTLCLFLMHKLNAFAYNLCLDSYFGIKDASKKHLLSFNIMLIKPTSTACISWLPFLTLSPWSSRIERILLRLSDAAWNCIPRMRKDHSSGE